MFDPRDFAADPRTRPEARPRRDHAKERENRERDGHRREYDPRGTKRQTFQNRTDRAVADVGMYRNVAYRDVVDVHFEGHPYTARRAVDQMVRSGQVQEHTAKGPQGGSYKVLTLTERGVERAERVARDQELDSQQKAWSGLGSEEQPMGHSTTQGRRRLTLPLPLRAKMTGLAIFICGFMGLITSAQLDPITAHVERVIDGDTIQVRVDGTRYTVRLIGVDTPETKHPTKPVQYFGREASAFTKAALAGKTVLLQKDRTGDTVDRYGRWLRYVLLDGDNFNARLIRDGYAHAYRRFPFSKRTEFIRLEEQARRRGIGLWNRR